MPRFNQLLLSIKQDDGILHKLEWNGVDLNQPAYTRSPATASSARTKIRDAEPLGTREQRRAAAGGSSSTIGSSSQGAQALLTDINNLQKDVLPYYPIFNGNNGNGSKKRKQSCIFPNGDTSNEKAERRTDNNNGQRETLFSTLSNIVCRYVPPTHKITEISILKSLRGCEEQPWHIDYDFYLEEDLRRLYNCLLCNYPEENFSDVLYKRIYRTYNKLQRDEIEIDDYIRDFHQQRKGQDAPLPENFPIPFALILSLQEDTRLRVLGEEGNERNIPVGNIYKFGPQHIHAGSSYKKENIRVHFYVDPIGYERPRDFTYKCIRELKKIISKKESLAGMKRKSSLPPSNQPPPKKLSSHLKEGPYWM